MKTQKKKKVMIALDYDHTSQKVAEFGYSFAKSMGAEVILLHVIVDLVYYSSTYLNMGPLQLDSENDLKATTQDFLDKSKLQLSDETIKTIIIEGEIAESIVNIANELKVDFIAMGSHSRRWLDNILIGSVAKDVLRNTNIPLFLVPTKKPKYE